MKNMLKLGISLAVYAVAACVLLAVVNTLTAPIIERTKAAEVGAGMVEIFTNADSFEIAGDFTRDASTSIQVERLYLAQQDGAVVGGVVQATGPTYDKATILIGLDLNQTITGIKFLALSDTPGFGQKATEPTFYEQFAGKSATDDFEAGSDVEAISGATITSKGVAQILKYAAYVAGNYLAANYGGATGSGAAPLVTAEAKPFTYEEAYVSLFPPETYPDAVFTDVGKADGNPRTMIVSRRVTVTVDGKVVGVMASAQGQSYHGPGVALTAVDLNLNILGARIIQLTDTPKIGLRALEESYWSKFADQRADAPLLAGAEYDTLSGASITADCVADMVKVGAVEAAKLAATLGGAAYDGGDDYPLNEHYLED
ncbi:MAG: FMN-binding protein [Treponema sp.]|jgi:electron transport complex protein RnfG|nr:FMN-binding protein [Treponema sp.]